MYLHVRTYVHAYTIIHIAPLQGCNDPPVTWNSLAMIQIASTSSIRYSGTLSYNLPSEVPSTAKEVLLFVNFEHGYSGPDRTTYFKIYTQEDDSHYEKYASLHTYSQSAWNTNSENMWLPVTSNRRVYVAKQGNTNLTRNLHFYMYVIGYR